MEEILGRYTETFIFGYSVVIFATWIIMIFAVLIDLWTGLEKARARKEKIRSHLLRCTFVKIGDYWRVQAFGLFIDLFGSMWWSIPIASLVVGLGVLLIEGRSVIENLHAKKSAAASLPSIIQKIIDAKSKRDASAIISLLQAQTENNNNKE